MKKSVRDDKQKYMGELAATAEEAVAEGNIRQLYDITRNLAGKYSQPQRPVNDEEGKPITETQGQRNR